MSGVVYHVLVDDRKVQTTLDRLIAIGQHPWAVMKDIAAYGENSTKQRFDDGVGPDGNAWKPSRRVMERGGKTLIDSSRLLDSITSDSGDDFAQWGSNAIYAAIHQAGGEISAKNGKSLFFRTPDGSERRVKKVTIPARPYLGVNDDDEANIVDIVNQHLQEAVTN